MDLSAEDPHRRISAAAKATQSTVSGVAWWKRLLTAGSLTDYLALCLDDVGQLNAAIPTEVRLVLSKTSS